MSHRLLRLATAAAAAAFFLMLLPLSAAAEEGTPVRITPRGSDPSAPGRVFYLKDASEAEAAGHRPAYLRPAAYLGLLPGLLVLAVLAARGKRWFAALLVCAGPLLLGMPAQEKALVSAGVRSFLAGRLVEAQGHFAEAERAGGPNAAVAYDRALCAYGLGRRAEAIASLLRCLRLEPGNAEYGAAFDAVSADYGLAAQVSPRSTLPLDLLFTAAVVLADLALAALGLFLARRGGGLFIAFSLLLAGAATATVLLVRPIVEARAPVAVVAQEEAALKRVPLDKAGVWIRLPEGTSVRLRGRAGAYALVRTRSDVEGWLRDDLLLEPAP